MDDGSCPPTAVELQVQLRREWKETTDPAEREQIETLGKALNVIIAGLGLGKNECC